MSSQIPRTLMKFVGGVKTRANQIELSGAAKKNLQTLYNKLTGSKEKMPSSFDWTYKNHKQIYDLIEQKNDSGEFILTIKTRKSYLSGLVSALQFLKKDYLAKQYEAKRDAMQKQIDTEYGENDMNRIGSYDDLISKRDELAKTRNRSLRDNYLYLTTALYTLQAPLRKEWRQVQFDQSKPFEKFKRSLNQKKKHYIFMDKNDNMILALGEYKSHPPINITLSKDLKKVILESLDVFPREWLFSDYKNKNKPLSNAEHVKLINLINLGDESNYRALYFSHMAAMNPNMNQNKKLDIATAMRTSVPMLDKVYRTINTNIKIPVSQTESKTIDVGKFRRMITDVVDKQLKQTIKIPVRAEDDEKTEQPQKKHWSETHKLYADYWRDKNKQKVCASSKRYYDDNLIRGRAKRYIWKLNNAKIKAPSKDKIKEYELIEDKDGLWGTKL